MKKLPIILILVFSCSVAWGSQSTTCALCTDKFVRADPLNTWLCYSCQELMDLGIARPKLDDPLTEVYKLQKEIQLLKDRIAELETPEGLGTDTRIRLEDVEVYGSSEESYHFSGGPGHNCGGTIDKHGISYNAVMCYPCQQDAIDEIKGK